MADFAIALNESIQEINKHSFNNFELRIGKSFDDERVKWVTFCGDHLSLNTQSGVDSVLIFNDKHQNAV